MRDPKSIAAAFDSIQGMQRDSQLQGFPTGHFVGFYLGIDAGRVVVAPGEANVGGTEVIQTTTNPVEENAWKVTRERGYMYYIYLKKDGAYWVDNQDPEWDSLLNGWYHPLLRYRYLGKVFNDSTGKIIYKLSAHYDQQSQIIVGAKGFTGYQDYECDGVDDQDEINLALRFARESGEELGGLVHLTRGYFKTTAAVEGLSNCVLEGEGQGATVLKKNCNDYGIECVGTSVIHKENFQVRNLTVTRDAADSNVVSLIHMSYVDDCLLQRVTVLDAVARCVYVDNAEAVKIADCVIDTNGNSNFAGIHFYTLAYRCEVESCEIRNLLGYGIQAESATCRYLSNRFTNVARSSVYVGGSTNVIDGNEVIDSQRNNATLAAIAVNSGTECIVSSNTCRNNGNLIERGDCESLTPPYLTGEADDSQRNCTFASSSATAAYSDSYEYLFTKTTASGAGPAYSFFHAGTATVGLLHGLVPGIEYTMTAYTKVPSGVGTASAGCFEIGDKGGTSAVDSTPVWLTATTDAWLGASCTRTIRASATSCFVLLGCTSSSALNFLIYIDHIRFTPIGVSNTHGQHFSDAGTRTMTNGNSWEL